MSTTQELAKEFCIREHPKGTREEIERACNKCIADATEWLSQYTGFEDVTPNLSEAEKVWRCRTCGVEQDSSGPVEVVALREDALTPEEAEHLKSDACWAEASMETLREDADDLEGEGWPGTANRLRHLINKYVHAKSLYVELIMAVARKHEGESRHETALRYIRQREEGFGASGAASNLDAARSTDRRPE